MQRLIEKICIEMDPVHLHGRKKKNQVAFDGSALFSEAFKGEGTWSRIIVLRNEEKAINLISSVKSLKADTKFLMFEKGEVIIL